MSTRTSMVLGSAAALSLGLFACGSSGDEPAPAMNTGGALSGGGTAGSTAGGGAANAGAAAGGAGTSGGGSGGAATGCTALMPTGTAHDLTLSEVAPGMGIEVFNSGTAAVPIDSIYFCSQFVYKKATSPSGKTEIAPGEYAAVAWPDMYELTTAQSGEILVMLGSEFPSLENTQSYVCWGSHSGGRKDDTTVGVDLLYGGDCAPALTAGSIVRKPGTNGMDASSWDTTPAPSLADCP